MKAAARRRKHWTPEEDARLALLLAEHGLEIVARRLGRSPRGVIWRAYALGLTARELRTQAAGLSVRDVAAGLGVLPAAVPRWVRLGWLRATVTTAGARVWYSIAVDDVAAFLESRGALLPELRPDAFWRSIVAECRRDLETRLVGSGDLTQALGFAGSKGLTYVRRAHGFPTPALSLGARNGGAWYERTAVAAWLDGHPQYATRAARDLVTPREGA